MRSVTFADADVIAAINERFICCWIDISSRPDDLLPEFTKDQLDSYVEGSGETALGVFFALSDGRLIHELRGWAKPKKFLEEAEFARGLTAENAAERRKGRSAPTAPLLSPIRDAVGGARGWAVG